MTKVKSTRTTDLKLAEERAEEFFFERVTKCSRGEDASAPSGRNRRCFHKVTDDLLDIKNPIYATANGGRFLRFWVSGQRAPKQVRRSSWRYLRACISRRVLESSFSTKNLPVQIPMLSARSSSTER
jgi:hypothetical protein